MTVWDDEGTAVAGQEIEGAGREAAISADSPDPGHAVCAYLTVSSIAARPSCN